MESYYHLYFNEIERNKIENVSKEIPEAQEYIFYIKESGRHYHLNICIENLLIFSCLTCKLCYPINQNSQFNSRIIPVLGQQYASGKTMVARKCIDMCQLIHHYLGKDKFSLLISYFRMVICQEEKSFYSKSYEWFNLLIKNDLDSLDDHSLHNEMLQFSNKDVFFNHNELKQYIDNLLHGKVYYTYNFHEDAKVDDLIDYIVSNLTYLKFKHSDNEVIVIIDGLRKSFEKDNKLVENLNELKKISNDLPNFILVGRKLDCIFHQSQTQIQSHHESRFYPINIQHLSISQIHFLLIKSESKYKEEHQIVSKMDHRIKKELIERIYRYTKGNLLLFNFMMYELKTELKKQIENNKDESEFNFEKYVKNHLCRDQYNRNLIPIPNENKYVFITSLLTGLINKNQSTYVEKDIVVIGNKSIEKHTVYYDETNTRFDSIDHELNKTLYPKPTEPIENIEPIQDKKRKRTDKNEKSKKIKSK